MVDALLFDLDGTLIETDPIHYAVFRELFAERGQDIEFEFYVQRIHGRLNAEIFAELFPEHDTEVMSDRKEALFRDRLGTAAPEMPGLSALLDQVRDAGIRVAIVTNAPKLNALAMLQAIGLTDRFETLVASEDCFKGKPDPEPYAKAMALLGVLPENCIAFEDSPSGIAAARAAGALTIGLRSTLDDAALVAAGAHRTIKDFTDPSLPGLLQTPRDPEQA